MSEQIKVPSFQGEILLCEDSSMNQELICGRLAKLGIKTIVAENGKEGVDQVVSRVQNGLKPFDLIFMDINMPVMDGLEATEKICKLNTGTPVVALSANSAPAEKEQYLAHGMTDCLNKPFTPKELSSCLLKYLKPADASEDETRNVQDEEKLRNKLINNFVKNNKTIYSQITKAISEGDIKLAHRLAHTLKGNAGILGKTALQKAADDVENLLKNNEDLDLKSATYQSAMAVLETELDAVLKEFEPLVDEIGRRNVSKVSEANSGTYDKQKAQALFDELEAMLDGGSVDCLNLIDSLRLIPGTEELIQQMEYFEFDTAIKTLEQLREQNKEEVR
jgi:CheY-like chemotaxis protein